MERLQLCSYFSFVSHGAFAQHGDLGPGFLLQTLDGVALGSQDLAHEIELEKQKQSREIWTVAGGRKRFGGQDKCAFSSLK